MTEYKCGNCREVMILSPKARFCPECGSSSLHLIIKELKEPAQKETLGVYTPPTYAGIDLGFASDNAASTTVSVPNTNTFVLNEPDTAVKEEEDQPRRRRRSS